MDGHFSYCEELERLLDIGFRFSDFRSSPERVRAALITRSGLLAIATHSDGVDAFLGPSLTLCAIDAGGPSAPTTDLRPVGLAAIAIGTACRSRNFADLAFRSTRPMFRLEF